jgi:ribonucleoside-diphosphate reductase alpha chain
LCEVPKNARTKVDTPALDLLNFVKLTKNNWVDSGRVPEICTRPWVSHNVSNTINFLPEEFDTVKDFIFDNRDVFTGVSLLPQSGDLDYIQAPYTIIKTMDEIVKTYGSGSLLASGVIVNACRVFDENLWAACDCVLGIGEKLEELNIAGMSHEVAMAYIKQQQEKKLWVKRAKKFAKNYFDGNVRKMTYCLKDVNNFKTWIDLEREYVDVPWELLYEDADNTKVEQSAACAGGQCEV